ncbi:pilin N-terminal domain-containing protein [uncultured Anaerococcus sp.]|uniref:pilin N-terminal domain-containing protein n=1 Tax=uncultured Anaerococcus sp. TaxID=293428 RepID=UPI0025EBD195|nr:pilin N-terminal domain-containing protein [uncultured Anaerococcus sp.]
MKRKILSLLTAFAMVFGIIAAPFTSVNAAGDSKPAAATETETLVVHKILMSDKALREHNVYKEGYDGNKIADIKEFFEANAKEIGGVYFKLQKPKEGQDQDKLDANNNDQWEDIKAGDPKYEGLTTKENGYSFNTKGLKGKYRIVEIHEKSTYVGDENETLTHKKAVPSIINLPVINSKDGILKEAHIYPKNTEEAPKTDKNFDKEAKEGEETLVKESDLVSETKDLEIKTDDPTREKSTASKKLGDKVPYKVVTEIPTQTKWATARWDDKMTEGLTYNGDVELTLEKTTDGKTYEAVQGFAKEQDYTVKPDGNGFVVEFTKDGLGKLNNKDYKQRVTLKYSATVNKAAMVEIPESNDVTFHYGNNPGHGNTPIPTKPKENGELEVEKTWSDGVPKAGEWAKFTLKNAKTGKEIGTVEFTTTDSGTTTKYTPADGYKAIGNEKPQGPTDKTDTNNVWKFKFTGLDKDLEYKVEEDNNMNETAKFTKGTDGQIKIENKKDYNPKPQNPSEPKVVNGGKKFVKTNFEDKAEDKENGKLERLTGAKFYIRDGEGEDAKYLSVKNDQGAVLDVTTKRDAYLNKVAAINKAENDLAKELNKEGAKETEVTVTIDGTAVKGKSAIEEKIKALNAEVPDLKKAYFDAVEEGTAKYEWTTNKADAYVLVSGEDGKMEIKDLAYGTYYLEEFESPEGYADNTQKVKFVVGEGSYKSNADATNEMTYNAKGNTENGYGIQIKNKKVTIPQTGGIGSLVFIAAGLVIMGGAFIAYRRSQATA